MRKYNLLIILTIIVVVLAVLLFGKLISNNKTVVDTVNPATTTPKVVNEASTPTTTSTEETGVIFATTADGQNLYINKTYGFSFVYPTGWRTGNSKDNFLQLFNFPKKDSSYCLKYNCSKFEKGENKIEMYIGKISTSSDDLFSDARKSKTISQVLIDNQTSIQKDEKWIDGTESKNFSVTLPNNSETTISLSMHGDPTNLNVFDQIVKNFRWTKK